jgi:hypothetical protein
VRRAPATTERAGEGSGLTSEAEVLALAHPDWLYHHLRVTGAPAEDWFHLLAAPPTPGRRTFSLEGCRILAGQLRDAVEARGRLVAERAATSRACPLCLHQLVPIPARLLRLGPEAPESRAWLWANWGTTAALRGVVELPVPGRGRPRRPDPGLFWVGFWSADWTPWQAILALRAHWRDLSIAVRPLYDDP